MDSHAIRCFQRVFEKESIHQAAKDLCLTPQGVSRVITALEGEMQTPLFVRSRKGMEATPEGRYFYEHTQELTRQLLDLQLGIHPFYDRPSITIENLKGQPLVGLNEHFSLFHSLVRRCADFGFTPQFVVKTMESRLIYHFCQERVGIGIDVNIHAAPPPLRYVPITEGTPWRIFFVCKKEKRGDSLFQEIIAALTSRHHP